MTTIKHVITDYDKRGIVHRVIEETEFTIEGITYILSKDTSHTFPRILLTILDEQETTKIVLNNEQAKELVMQLSAMINVDKKGE
jgi:hypothetical protein